MLITTKFGSNNKITATTILAGEKITAKTTRNFRFGALHNSDLAVEKLMAKIGDIGYFGDSEYIIESTDSGYIYILNNEDTLKSVISWSHI